MAAKEESKTVRYALVDCAFQSPLDVVSYLTYPPDSVDVEIAPTPERKSLVVFYNKLTSDSKINLEGRKLADTPKQRQLLEEWAKKLKMPLDNIGPAYAMEPQIGIDVAQQFVNMHRATWREAIVERYENHPNRFVATTVRAAMDGFISHKSRENEYKVLGAALQLLPACDLIRKPWQFADTMLPLHPILQQQIQITIFESIVEPLTTEVADFLDCLFWNSNQVLVDNFVVFQIAFLLLHNADLAIANYSERSMPRDVLMLQETAERMLVCFHGKCSYHAGFAPDWHNMVKEKSNQLDVTQMQYAEEVANFIDKPDIQADFLNSQKSKVCTDDSSCWPVQLFQKNWEPMILCRQEDDEWCAPIEVQGSGTEVEIEVEVEFEVDVHVDVHDFTLTFTLNELQIWIRGRFSQRVSSTT